MPFQFLIICNLLHPLHIAYPPFSLLLVSNSVISKSYLHATIWSNHER